MCITPVLQNFYSLYRQEIWNKIAPNFSVKWQVLIFGSIIFALYHTGLDKNLPWSASECDHPFLSYETTKVHLYGFLSFSNTFSIDFACWNLACDVIGNFNGTVFSTNQTNVPNLVLLSKSEWFFYLAALGWPFLYILLTTVIVCTYQHHILTLVY